MPGDRKHHDRAAPLHLLTVSYHSSHTHTHTHTRDTHTHPRQPTHTRGGGTGNERGTTRGSQRKRQAGKTESGKLEKIRKNKSWAAWFRMPTREQTIILQTKQQVTNDKKKQYSQLGSNAERCYRLGSKILEQGVRALF